MARLKSLTGRSMAREFTASLAAHHRALRRRALRQCGERADRDRFHRGPDAEVANLLRIHAACLRDELGHREAARASLARAHAAAGEGLELAGAVASEG